MAQIYNAGHLQTVQQAGQHRVLNKVENLQFSLPQRGLGMEMVYTAGFGTHRWGLQASEHGGMDAMQELGGYCPHTQREVWASALYADKDVETLNAHPRLDDAEKLTYVQQYQALDLNSWPRTEKIGVSYVNEGSHAMSYTGIKTEFWQMNFDAGKGGSERQAPNQGYNEMRGRQLRNDIKNMYYNDASTQGQALGMRRHLVIPFTFMGDSELNNRRNVVGLMNLDLSAILWSTSNDKYVPVVEVAVFEYEPEISNIKFWDSFIDLNTQERLMTLDSWSVDDVRRWLEIHEFTGEALLNSNMDGREFRTMFFDNRDRIEEYSARFKLHPRNIAELVMLVSRAVLHATQMSDGWMHNMSFQDIRHFGVSMTSHHLREKQTLRDFMMSAAQLFVEQFLIEEIEAGEDLDMMAVPNTFVNPHPTNVQENAQIQSEPMDTDASANKRQLSTGAGPASKRVKTDSEPSEQRTSDDVTNENKTGGEELQEYRQQIRSKMMQFNDPRKFIFVFYPNLYAAGSAISNYGPVIEKCLEETTKAIKTDTSLTPMQVVDHEEIVNVLKRFGTMTDQKKSGMAMHQDQATVAVA